MKNLFKGKNLLLVALVAGGAYWYWNKMKKDKAAADLAAKAKATPSESNWTGSYFNMQGGKPTAFDKDGLPNVNMAGYKK